MRAFSSFSRNSTGLLVIDVQEKLVPHLEHGCEVVRKMKMAVEGFQILGLPIYVTEQNPKGLGETIPKIKASLSPAQVIFSKTTFSVLQDPGLADVFLSSGIEQWVLIGIEAHICVLQTARSLLEAGKQAAVLNDAISSRNIYDFSTAIAEMRDMGVRITSLETMLFELLVDSKAQEFKDISQLVK